MGRNEPGAPHYWWSALSRSNRIVALVGGILGVVVSTGTILAFFGVIHPVEPTAPPQGAAVGAPSAMETLPGATSALPTATRVSSRAPDPTTGPTPSPTLSPSPSAPSPTDVPETPAPPSPVTGTVMMAGSVASEPPGTFVAAGAVVTSIVDKTVHTTEFFSIEMRVGQVLAIRIKVDDLGACGGVNTYIAYPETGFDDKDWIYLGQGEGTYRWQVPVSGLYPVQIRDCGGGKPVRYTVAFGVHD
jgi:hypothetical protein